MNQFNCRICAGKRPHNGMFCLGCGSDVSFATDRRPREYRDRTMCKKCASRGYEQMPDGKLSCRACGADAP